MVEQFADEYSGFLYLDKDGLPEEALHWVHRFHHAETYCSNRTKAGMNPETLQYLMGYSDIGVTTNSCTHLGLEDAREEIIRMEELNKTTGEKPVTQKMFRAI